MTRLTRYVVVSREYGCVRHLAFSTHELAFEYAESLLLNGFYAYVEAR